MKEIFDLEVLGQGDRDGEPEVRICVCLQIGGREALCPISDACRSVEDLESAVRSAKGFLDGVFQKGRDLFEGGKEPQASAVDPRMSPEEIWGILSNIPDEGKLIDGFNALDEAARKKVAEYVLTQCNIFAGNAAVFSSRYDEASGLMDGL
ncbi:MAG: hypothetical protein JW821_10545 [Deltaproteobacteria bacterium]|nr:hypothetical protein [Deltaproteobacteria bacterium]